MQNIEILRIKRLPLIARYQDYSINFCFQENYEIFEENYLIVSKVFLLSYNSTLGHSLKPVFRLAENRILVISVTATLELDIFYLHNFWK